MSDIPDNIINVSLYREAIKIANETYKRKSAYKSMFIVKKYKQLGGKYKDEKNKEQSTKKWVNEEWIQIRPYVKEGKKIKCGFGDNAKACRPLKGDNITMEEIIKKFGSKKVLELTNKKIKDMDGRLDWKIGKFTPSK